ncbi:unnamed protein product, partial [Ixodes pacificus]
VFSRYRFYANFGLDVIARCLFGIKLKPHSDVTNKFVIEAKRAFSRNLTLPIVAIYLFPGLIQWFNVKLLNFDIIRCFKDLAAKAIRERDKGGHKFEDYLNLLMDAREERHDTNGYPNRCETPERSGDVLHGATRRMMATFFSALSEVEVLAQCVVMFLSGQDSTSSVIAHTVYLLALHPDKQMKLREEVDRCFSSHVRPVYPSVRASPLIKLRGLVSLSARACSRSQRTVEGTSILLEEYACIHGSDAFFTWPTLEYVGLHPLQSVDSQLVTKDEFSEDNAASVLPYTYLPFGAGPKGCLGMNLALLAVKLCLLYSLRVVEFVRTSKTKVPLKFYNGFGLLHSAPFSVGIKKRSTTLTSTKVHTPN